MRIATRDIPQADSLDDVIRTAVAVGGGRESFQEIADAIGKTERQGRYYRLAAELLGFIEPMGVNRYQLTPRGEALLAAHGNERQQLVVASVLGSLLVQRVLPFLEARAEHGCTRDEIENFISSVTQEATGLSMIPRRTSTVTSWLQSVGMLRQEGDTYFLQGLPGGVPIVQYGADDEPLLPEHYDLDEYVDVAARVAAGGTTIQYEVGRASRDRATEAHQQLVRVVASKIRDQGAVPRQNGFIDLAARIGDAPYIFEMKSTVEGNFRQQIRRGVSQLYEYRYMQGIPNAFLVLVTELPLPPQLGWMIDYLAEDRQILPVWDGNGDVLDCDNRHRQQLGFLL